MSKLIESPVEKLAGGMSFTEGPCWIAEHGMVLFTDIPANAIMRWKEGEGLSTWRANAHFAIGLARDRRGRLLVCEHSTRCVSALTIEKGGNCGPRRVIANGYDGFVLNSTNDVVCASDGTIIFTDPPFGVRTLDGALHGYQQASELAACHVFRATRDAAAPVSVLDTIFRPNGLCLSPDEKRLYVSDSSDKFHKVLVGDAGGGWAITNLRDFAVMPAGVPDGMRCDAEGNLWVSGGDGVHVYDAAGRHIDHAPAPEMVTNLDFGGEDGRDVYITAVSSLYRLRSAVKGALC